MKSAKIKILYIARVIVMGCVIGMGTGAFIAISSELQSQQFTQTQQEEDSRQNTLQQINELEKHQQEINDTLKQVQEQVTKQQKDLEERQARYGQLQAKLEGMSVVTDIPPGLETYIKETAKANNYRPELLLGIIQNESSWNYNEVSDTNDYGLCQINAVNFNTYRKQIINKYGEFNEFNPYISVDLMAGILNDFKKMYYSKYKEYPTEKSLLLAYNSGKLRSDFQGNTYTSRVLKYTNEYKLMLEVKDEMSYM